MSTVKVQDAEIILLESNASKELTTTTMVTIKNPTTKQTGSSVLSHFKYQHLLAGISGGAISTLILHPLDLMKIRFAGINISTRGKNYMPSYFYIFGIFW